MSPHFEPGERIATEIMGNVFYGIVICPDEPRMGHQTWKVRFDPRGEGFVDLILCALDMWRV